MTQTPFMKFPRQLTFQEGPLMYCSNAGACSVVPTIRHFHYFRHCTHLLLITDQLNRGSAVLDQGKECRHFVMTLNLQASKVARRRFAESLVHRFLTKAVHLVVEKTDWDTCYELVVELYIALAAVESSRHAVEHSNALTEQVVKVHRILCSS